MNYVFGYVALAFRRALLYPANFSMIILANIVHYSTFIFLIWLLMRRTNSIGGWAYPDIIFMYAFGLASYSLFGLFFQQLIDVSQLVTMGRLDIYILRPRIVFFQIMFNGFNPVFVGHFILAISILSYVIVYYDLEFGMKEYLFLASAMCCALVIQISIGVVAACIGMLTTDSISAFTLLVYTPRDIIMYPISIYPTAVQIIVTFILPIAFLNYYPVASVLGKEIPFGSAVVMGIYPITVVAFGSTCLLWRHVLRKYESTGS